MLKFVKNIAKGAWQRPFFIIFTIINRQNPFQNNINLFAS